MRTLSASQPGLSRKAKLVVCDEGSSGHDRGHERFALAQGQRDNFGVVLY